MKEYKVGEQIVLKVVKSEKCSCKGCYFACKSICSVCSTYPCGKKFRSDNTDVIFVEKKNKEVMAKDEIRKMGIKLENLQPDDRTFYDMNVLVQCMGCEDNDEDRYKVYPLNFMPRKERCCDLEFDLSNEEQKEEFLKHLRDSQERLKILSLLLHKQEEEIIEYGYPKTDCYYPDLDSLEKINFKEDKQ